MFAPDGFVPLSEITKACWNIAEDRFPRADPWDVFGADIRARLYAELLFSRFVAGHINEMWVFQYPNLTLRAWPAVFGRTRTYEGPCPMDPKEAESEWEHLEKGPRLFLTKAMRVNADVARDEIDVWELEETIEAVKPLHGALACWKPADAPSDLERAVWPFRDEEYFRGHPHFRHLVGQPKGSAGIRATWEAFKEICPDGKDASGLTWSEIEAKTGYSRRHITRAIATLGAQKDGQKGGQGLGK